MRNCSSHSYININSLMREAINGNLYLQKSNNFSMVRSLMLTSLEKSCKRLGSFVSSCMNQVCISIITCEICSGSSLRILL